MNNVIADVVATLKDVPPCLAKDIVGFTSPKVRMLLHRLVGRLPAEEAYFEVGCLRGATLISALLDHRSSVAHVCDNWSEFRKLNAKAHFQANLKAYKDRLPEIAVHEEDCFGLATKRPFRKPIGLFFYDGEHSFEAQRRAVMAFAPHLASNAILLVDDWNGPDVRRGTWAGLHEIRPKALSFLELPARHNGDVEQYWNGIGAFHIQLR